MSNDIHALSGAYAADALDADERADFEQHLAVCEACRNEVDGLRMAATEIAATTVTEPPASLRASVLAGIRDVRPLPPLETVERIDAAAPLHLIPEIAPVGEDEQPAAADTPSTVVPLRRRTVWARVGLAAAAAVVVAGGTTVAIHPWTDTAPSSNYATPAQQVMRAADVQHFSTPIPGGKVTVYRSAALDRAVVVTRGLKAAPSGKVYELWLQTPKGAMLPGGLFTDGSDLTQLVRGHAGGARGLGITLEPSGGSPVPTSAPLALVEFA